MRIGSSRLLARLAAAALPLLLAWWPLPARSQGDQQQAHAPNIILILSDDEDVAGHAYMPKTKALIEQRGANFTNFFITYSFCCPSRSTILRGQYPHNHRIEGNEWPTGGFEKFRTLGHEGSTVATWLDAAGYHTAILGKYLNGYLPEKDRPAKGWDDWWVTGDAFANFNYVVNDNGKLVRYGNDPEDYLTDVLGTRAVEIIKRAATEQEPLFMIAATFTPHSPATPAPRHEGLFANEPLPKPKSYDEEDVSDKIKMIRDLPRLAPWQHKALEEHHRDRLRSLQSNDDLVERIVKALQETGELKRTYLIYASDNGFHMGLHRLFIGKTTAYEEDIRVPMVIRGPGIPAGITVEQMVLNNDLAPTFAEMAGVKPPSFVDGRSFLPLFQNGDLPWRRSFLIERREMETHEITGAAVFDAIRTPDFTFVQYGTGEREFYDLNRDPLQLQNRVEQMDPAIQATLTQRLAELMNCAGANCRQVEDKPLDPRWSPLAAQ